MADLHKALQAALDDGNVNAAKQIMLLIEHSSQIDDKSMMGNQPIQRDPVIHQVHGGRVLADDQGRLLNQTEDLNSDTRSLQADRAQEVYSSQDPLSRKMDAAEFAALRQGLGAAKMFAGETPEQIKRFEEMVEPWKKGNPGSTLAGQVMAAPGNPSGRYTGSIAAGALQGAEQGDPNHQGVAGAVGGATAGAMPLLGKALKAIGKGAIKYTPGAQGLIDDLSDYGRKAFVPLTGNNTQSSPLANAVSALIGTRKTNPQIDRQAITLEDQVRRSIADRSAGERVPGNTLEEMASNASAANQRNLRNNLGDYALNLEGSEAGPLDKQMLSALKRNGMPDQLADVWAKGLSDTIGAQSTGKAGERFIYGHNLHNAYTQIETALEHSNLSPQQVDAVRKAMYQPINRGISEGGDEMARSLEDYIPQASEWRGELQPWVSRAQAHPERGGNYPLRELLTAAPEGSGTRNLAARGYQAVGDEVDRSVPPSMGDLLRGFAHGPVMGAASLGLRPALGSQAVGRALTGDTPLQQALRAGANSDVVGRILAGARAPAVANEVDRNASGQ